MRPLTHLGVGPNSVDYKLYEENEALYDELSERGDVILDEAYKIFMGDHAEPPQLTRDELNKKYEEKLRRKSRLAELRAPKEILDYEDSVIVELYQQLQNKKYASLSDPVYQKYKDTYDKRDREWHKSAILKGLLAEIYAYNEAKYNEYKGISNEMVR
jgi:polyhydroxyalkanoate synthesis regulator phasin